MAITIIRPSDMMRTFQGYPLTLEYQDNTVDETDGTGANAHVYQLDPRCSWFSYIIGNPSTGGVAQLQVSNDTEANVKANSAQWSNLGASVAAGQNGNGGQPYAVKWIRLFATTVGTVATFKLHLMMGAGNAQS